jgi:rhamnosyltransferase
MKCSIAIRAYNESQHLGRLLTGIAQQTCQDVETILVDSGSRDDTVAIARSFGAKIVHISPEDFTFGRALNRGIEAATREQVVIASAHAYPIYPDWIERLLAPLDDAQVALVYGRQRGVASSRFSEHRIFRQWFPDHDIRPQPSPFCNNANAAIRRSLWQQHPYDESLTGLEDVAWAKWAQSQGLQIAYAAHAEVAHVHAETMQGVYNRYRREGMAFKRIFPEAHFSIYDVVRLSLSNVLGDLRQASREHLLRSSSASIVWFRLAQFWGTYQGYRRSSAVTQELRERFYYPHGSEPREAHARAVEPIQYNEAAQKDAGDDRGPS